MKEVLINAGAGETRVAIVEDGGLEELFLERTIGLDDGHVRKKGGRHGHSLIGNIILGRVQRRGCSSRSGQSRSSNPCS